VRPTQRTMALGNPTHLTDLSLADNPTPNHQPAFLA
jgi:hypothetical protein